MANRLAGESSPYLLQHRENPVDWFPWGSDALAAARAADKPVFVSIGYAACHWCHVMARESFEDPETAALMNDLFINVKVDREERPEVDAIYMNAIHVMGESGGWPLSAFCDEAGRPFFLGTYFPPAERYGRPGFASVLRTMARVYRERRDQVGENTAAVLDGLRSMDEHYRRGARREDLPPLARTLLIGAGRKLVEASDPDHGGFGKKPKFPSPSALELLGRAGRLEFGAPASAAFFLQLERMARGGIYDHLGGGFARYSVDERWAVPHFEKMLCDNAQLLGLYGDIFALRGDIDAGRVIEETVGWLEREMSDEAGGLHASLDAESGGEEGAFYVWEPSEIRAVLGSVDAMLFSAAYGVTEAGNFEHGMTVLSRVSQRGADSDEAALADMRRRLLAARESRARPAADEKVLAAWNGLAVTGLVRAWKATGHTPALALAIRVGRFLKETMCHTEGSAIWRVYKGGKTHLGGTLDDHAFVAEGFFALAEATGEESWWSAAEALLNAVLDRFYAEEEGVDVFYLTAHDSGEPLVHRPESLPDGAIPSGAAVAVECLLRLGRVGGNARALAVAESYLGGRAPQVADEPLRGARLLSALDLHLHGRELVVSGGAGEDALRAAARAVYAPDLLWVGPWADESFLRGREPAADGRARAFVCRQMSCEAPVSDPAALRALLAPAPSTGRDR